MRAKLGQNFLVDRNWQEKIVSQFKPEGGQIIEIGPGRSAITQHLIKKFKNFLVIEFDRELHPLHESQEAYQLIAGDFKLWNFCHEGVELSDISFIGNLPYESATRMIIRICERHPLVRDFLFLVQKEVCERLCGEPGSRDYGFLSVLVQTYFDLEALEVVPPGAFKPPPKVDSQLVRARKRSDAISYDEEFVEFLKQAFSNKRKQMRNPLKKYYPLSAIERTFEQLQLSGQCRAEEIPLDLWPKIFQLLRQS